MTVSPRKAPSEEDGYSYTVKIINQRRKSDYTMEALPSSTCRFTSIDNLKKTLSETFGFQVGSIGFVEPGHGLKGRQHWLVRDKDLQDMYSVHKKRRVITLWCFRPTVGGAEPSSSRKRSLSEGAEGTAPRPKSHCAQKIKDVEDLISQLKERHGKAFTTEQLSCWAHMYHMEKHNSLDIPPDIPFFTGSVKKKKVTNDDNSVAPCNEGAKASCGISPSKRVNLRTESIKQLVEWHSLLEKGGISQEVYEDMQQAILKDIKDNMV